MSALSFDQYSKTGNAYLPQNFLSSPQKFFELSHNLQLTENERKEVAERLQKLFNAGFEIRLTQKVGGANQSWPNVVKKGISVPGIAIFTHGAAVSGGSSLTLKEYLSKLEELNELITKAKPSVSSSLQAMHPDRQCSEVSSPKKFTSAKDFVRDLQLAKIPVAIRGPASYFVTEGGTQEECAAALAFFKIGDTYYEDSEGEVVVIRNQKIIAQSPEAKILQSFGASEEPIRAQKIAILDSEAAMIIFAKKLAAIIPK